MEALNCATRSGTKIQMKVKEMWSEEETTFSSPGDGFLEDSS